MPLKWIKASRDYQSQITEMLEEWTAYNQTHEANQSPWAIFKNDFRDFDRYVENLDCKEPRDGLVPDSTFFCLDEDRNILVGAVNIRHELNDYLVAHGGHIGD